MASSGDAMKIDEYAPVVNPMNNANPKSCNAEAPSTQAPMTRIDRMGSTATKLVLIDRASTWFIETLTVSV
jgi:hypothetical protein